MAIGGSWRATAAFTAFVCCAAELRMGASARFAAGVFGAVPSTTASVSCTGLTGAAADGVVSAGELAIIGAGTVFCRVAK
jgi:hypothetical protein